MAAPGAGAGLVVVGLDQDRVGRDLFVVDELRAGEHRRAGHPELGQSRQPVRGAVGGQRLLRQCQPGVDVVLAIGRRGETRVVVPLGLVEGRDQRLPLAIGLDRHADVAGGGLVDEIDEARRPRLVEFIADEGLTVHVGMPEEIDHGVEHRHPHVLAGRAAGPCEQRRRDRLGGDIAGELVRHDRAHQPRAGLVRAALDAGQARERLDQRIVDRIAGIGPVLAEAADRTINDVRGDGADRVLADAHALGHARTKVLDEHIGVGTQGLQRGDAGLGFQIQRHRALVAVVVEIARRETVAPVGRQPRVVADVGALDLEYFRTLIGELHGRQWPGHHGGRVDDAKTG